MSIFSSSPMALDTISDMAVRQITEILYIDSDSYWDAGAERWLSRQKTKVGKLTNTELLRSKPALFQKARKASLRQQGAILCSAHEALDPRVIRSLLWNIAYECTAETNKYRVLRIKGRLEVNLTEKELEQIDKQNCELNKWMDWINEISVLWLGENKYRQLCRPTKTVYLPECIKTRCEACMLATVGGSIPYLTALRASLLARQAYKTMKSKGKKAAAPPPLLRVIDSWISLIQGEAKRSINIYSDEFVHLLVEMRVLARRLEDEQIGRRQRRGSPPLPDWGAGMVSWTKDGLPEPLKDRPRKRPVRRDTTMWTTERAQSHGETTCEDSSSSSSSSSSVKMRGGVQTEVDSDDGEAGDEDELLGGNGYHGTDDRDVFEFEENGNEEGFLYGGGYDGADERVMFALEEAGNEERSTVRDSHNRIDWAQEVRRIDVKSTATLVSLYDCYRRLPGDHWLSNVQPSGSVFPFTVDPQESTSSWTSGVVDDDTDIYDDDDDDDGRLVEMETMSYSDGNAVKSADNENTETEVTTPAHHEDGGSSAPPETSSVYSCDIQDKDDTHNGNNDATVAMENPFDVGLRPLSRYERVSAVPAPLERIDATGNAMKEISETENNKKEGEETDKKAEDEEDRRREKLRNEALAKLEGRRYDGKGEQQGAGKKRRRSETSATLQDRRLEEEEERPTLVKSEGGDRAASCFESMGWGGPRK